MKLSRITLVLLLTLPFSAISQVALSSGDVYTYQFSSLPEKLPGAGFSETPIGGFSLSLSSFDVATDVLFVEMFENSTNEPPLLTFVAEASTDGSIAPNGWGDFQGVVRFTMVSGSATLEAIRFFYETPVAPNTWEVHQLTVVPVRAADLIAQLVPCAGPLSGGRWRNHGEYVAAVGKVSRALLAEGRISEDEAEAILKESAESNCGKP